VSRVDLYSGWVVVVIVIIIIIQLEGTLFSSFRGELFDRINCALDRFCSPDFKRLFNIIQ